MFIYESAFYVILQVADIFDHIFANQYFWEGGKRGGDVDANRPFQIIHVCIIRLDWPFCGRPI